jgi:hypothetical protein
MDANGIEMMVSLNSPAVQAVAAAAACAARE